MKIPTMAGGDFICDFKILVLISFNMTYKTLKNGFGG